ncbi:alginate export family protein [Roseovarius aestuarii]|uniref:Alginate production protein AlgE n=1 Tax=Roseovarius aestuarii TaxID=475083 RepID=A0A1X7BUM8_9RHOB|nr:alginate export family protein [Roseovarius aestuarii]SMC13265.1 Alginate production protein AlgE precursor [Roseovarius aestuarii]
MKQICKSIAINSVCVAAISAALISGVPDPAAAEDSDSWVELPLDDAPHVSWQLSDSISIGAAAEVSAQRSENLNPQLAADEDEIEIDLGMLHDNGGAVTSYLEFSLSSDILHNNRLNARDLIFDVNEAYISFRSNDGNQTLTLGRWSVTDDREWLFDQELDGIHFFRRGEKFAVELFYARERLFNQEFLSSEGDDEPDYFYARAYARLTENNVGSLYSLFQMGRDPGDPDLLWLGASLAGTATNDITYWAEFAHVRGTEANRKVRGYGFDVGLTKTFDQFRFNPRVTAGIAFGSGDTRRGTDTAFRQTGLQGNSGQFGGQTSFAYYGEVFDPELSNLTILTIGAGFDWLEDSSLDVMYHTYFQHKGSARIRDSALGQRPSGRSRRLGQEIDVIVAIREFESFDIDVFGGVYFPGSAFSMSDQVAGAIGVEINADF